MFLLCAIYTEMSSVFMVQNVNNSKYYLAVYTSENSQNAAYFPPIQARIAGRGPRIRSISPEWLWLTWSLVNVAHLAIACTAACFRLPMWHIWQSPAPLPASGYHCGTSGNPLHRSLLQVISPDRLWLTWLLVKWLIWQSPAPLPASGYQSRMVMAYLVVGKCGTSGNPLHHCLLQVISPEWLWLTWLLVNVAHLAIPCTAACFRLSVLIGYGLPGCW